MLRKSGVQFVQLGIRMEYQIPEVRKKPVHGLSAGRVFYGACRCRGERKGGDGSSSAGLYAAGKRDLPGNAGRERTEMAHD